jgi:superfamily II DNA or RNA helicase
MADYSFQYKAALKIVNDCENSQFLGSVLASAVGSGKTTILIHAANLILGKDPEARILYLAHAQDVLRRQVLESLNDPNGPVKVGFSFGGLNSGAQLEVSIPQEVNSRKANGKYTHLFVDEAHSWFASDSILLKIIKELGIQKLILASGTISLFNRYNKNSLGKKFAITYVAGEDMLRLGVYSSVDIDLVRVANYVDVKANLREAFRRAALAGDSLEKPIVVCQDGFQAKEASSFLTSHGIKVAFATAKADPSNLEIEKFKKSKNMALILVNRGVLGLNVPDATSMFFLKRTTNREIILQALARLFRLHHDGRKKFFWMPATSTDWNQKVALLHKTLSLNKLAELKSYCG